MSSALSSEQDEVTPTGESETIVLDACVIINLYASRRMREILSDLHFSFAAAESVSTDETLYVRRGGDGEDAAEKDPLELQAMISSGSLTLLSLESEAEEETFVTLAAEMDDGEALTLAIALNRGFSVATDDRKARRSLAGEHSRVYSTLELLHQWAGTRALSAQEIAVLLSNVRDRGKFVPPRGDPFEGWWNARMSSQPKPAP